MLISMSRFGSSLSTRSSGRAVYAEVVEALSSSECERLVFDFADVPTVTNSFADEVFGRLVVDFGMDRLKKKTSFTNIDKFPAQVIRIAMENRCNQELVNA